MRELLCEDFLDQDLHPMLSQGLYSDTHYYGSLSGLTPALKNNDGLDQQGDWLVIRNGSKVLSPSLLVRNASLPPFSPTPPTEIKVWETPTGEQVHHHLKLEPSGLSAVYRVVEEVAVPQIVNKVAEGIALVSPYGRICLGELSRISIVSGYNPCAIWVPKLDGIFIPDKDKGLVAAKDTQGEFDPELGYASHLSTSSRWIEKNIIRIAAKRDEGDYELAIRLRMSFGQVKNDELIQIISEVTEEGEPVNEPLAEIVNFSMRIAYPSSKAA